MPRSQLYRLILGFAGHGPNKVSMQESLDVLRIAAQHNINHVDCAPHYHNGGQENILSVARQLVSDEGLKPPAIITKVGRVIAPFLKANTDRQSPRTIDGFSNSTGLGKYFDYSEHGIKTSVEQSMMRMGLNSLHGVAVHDLDPKTHGNDYPYYHRQFIQRGGRDLLLRLKKEGVINSVGIGSNDPDGCMKLLGEGFKPDYVMIAGAYTLLDFSASKELFPYCQENGIAIYSAAPFAGGMLSGEENNTCYRYTTLDKENAADRALLQRFAMTKTICDEHGIEVPHAALQFVLMNNSIQKVVVGPRTIAQLTKTINWAETSLPLQFWQDLVQRKVIPASTIISSSHRISVASSSMFKPKVLPEQDLSTCQLKP